MIREEFFEKIRNECSSDEEYLIELLKLRGFLFEEGTNKLTLSDNSDRLDRGDLNNLLKKYGIGYVDKEGIVIDNLDCSEFIKKEFRENNGLGGGSIIGSKDWRWFKRRIHGYKVPVGLLEPFIARYLKAISACCVLTVGCCDGNHPNSSMMYIMMQGEVTECWHKLICRKCLEDRFNIHWINNYTAMSFTDETQFDTYYEVNKAAEYLYNNRKTIRSIKEEALKEMTNSYLKRTDPKIIKREFVDKASKLFDSSALL